MNYYLSVLKKYAVFSGRASRAEYWYFVLFNVIIYIVLAIVENMMGFGRLWGGNMGVLTLTYEVAVIIPSLAVMVRRLHDTNRTGFWVLINVIPLIGFIIILVFACTDSQPGDNQYGPNPKGITSVPPMPKA